MGFRNPITSAAAVDTRPGATVPGVRLYEAGDANARWGVVEFTDPAADAPARVTGRTNAGAGGSIQGGSLALKGPSTNGTTGPELDLKVQPAATSGYEAVATLLGAARLEVPALTDPSGRDFYNAGTSAAALVGAAPPAGTRLLTKVFSATVAGNAAGDATIAYPGGAFPNGLVGITVASYPPNATAPGGYFWDPYRPASLGSLNLRCFLGSTVVASPSLGLTVVAVGW